MYAFRISLGIRHFALYGLHMQLFRKENLITSYGLVIIENLPISRLERNAIPLFVIWMKIMKKNIGVKFLLFNFGINENRNVMIPYSQFSFLQKNE